MNKEELIEELVKAKCLTEHLTQEERNEYFEMRINEINSCPMEKPRTLGENEAQEEVCSCPTDAGHSTNKFWCYDCNKPYSQTD